MRVVLVSKAFVVGAYQRKLEEIAALPEVEALTVVVPPSWQEPEGRNLRLERAHLRGYDLLVEPIRLNGNFHLFYWPGLGKVLRDRRPDVVHVDEEPYNLATVLASWEARRVGAAPVFFTWQNLLRRYPPPFSLFERYVYAVSPAGMAGNAEAVGVLRQKGYRGQVEVVPQVGVDPEAFAPSGDARRADAPFTLGFAGRLVEEKGILVLLEALAGVEGAWRLEVLGSGPLATEAQRRAEALGIAPRIVWEASVPSTAMPARLRGWDLAVLPSLTRANWKEQFGRLLVEAMACGVAVVGSNSGEIPNVIGDAGIVVPEDDAGALREAITRLRASPDMRQVLGRKGRARVLDHFTHRGIAARTASVYRAALERCRPTL